MDEHRNNYPQQEQEQEQTPAGYADGDQIEDQAESRRPGAQGAKKLITAISLPPLPPPARPPWQAWETLMVLLAAVGLSSLPLLLLNTRASAIGLSLLAMFLQDAAFFLGPVFIVTCARRQSPAALGLVPVGLASLLRVGLSWGVALYLVNVACSWLSGLLLPAAWQQPQQVMNLLSLATRPLDIVLLLVLIVALAPVAEEMLFRAFLLPPLLCRLPRWGAYLLAGAVFAGIHLNLAAFLPLLAGGVGFCWLYDKYRNLHYNIAAHVVWNSISLTMYFLFG